MITMVISTCSAFDIQARRNGSQHKQSISSFCVIAVNRVEMDNGTFAHKHSPLMFSIENNVCDIYGKSHAILGRNLSSLQTFGKFSRVTSHAKARVHTFMRSSAAAYTIIDCTIANAFSPKYPSEGETS